MALTGGQNKITVALIVAQQVIAIYLFESTHIRSCSTTCYLPIFKSWPRPNTCNLHTGSDPSKSLPNVRSPHRIL
ncbi:hypothetical protein B0F90DRAFT_256917 [Multifurca ochricompacta]|uniref:Uncharacterized protein n=1 Tax=Multifurca ochricompacta TaxID=376703 RepID=A0AAD4M728_9AGAM|nr:hypothetical protein B0F90DRAFT_256917 [Multifurca ochricompacta]